MHPLARKIHDVLNDVICLKDLYALLGFPNHPNVGDSAIWLGEVDYLRRKKAKIKYSCHEGNYDPEMLRVFHRRGSILIHGGGNFGDLWEYHQRLRESILKGFTDRKVIQLPQTIHFQSLEKLEACRRVVGSHGNMVLIVRDRYSLDFARKHFDCEIRLCPDMAFAMRPDRLKKTVVGPPVKAIYLSRTDKESAEKAITKNPPGLLIADWLNETPPRLSKRYQMTGRIEPRRCFRLWFPVQAVRSRYAESMAQERLNRGCRFMSRSQCLVTDRLHGMILGAVLGKKVYAFDNSYGKLSSFFETWRSLLPEVTFFKSEQAAIDAALS